MPELIVLGTAASVPDAEHDTIGLLLRGEGGPMPLPGDLPSEACEGQGQWAVLVDCGGSPLHRLARLGVDLEHLSAVVFTHRHADHLYGFPMLVQGLWLAGRQRELGVYGPREALDTAARLLELFDLDRASRSLIVWHPVALRRRQPVLTVGGVQILASPVVHGAVKTVALRFDCPATGRSVVYSSDTEPCPALIELAAGADILIHEATGQGSGHSSPAEAAEAAREAGVSALVLIHYPVRGVDLEVWLRQASPFPGPVALACEGDRFPL